MTAVRLLAAVGVVGVLLFGFAVVAGFAVRSTGSALLVLAAALAALAAMRHRRRGPSSCPSARHARRTGTFP